MKLPISIACLLIPAIAQAELTRGPYVQLVTQESMTIVWRTDLPSTGRVSYGLDPESLTQSLTDTSTTQHEVKLTGLSPATKYCYAIEDDAGVLAGARADYCFKTAPADTPPFTFWVVGDSGTASGKQGRVRDKMLIHRNGDLPEVYIHVGDMAYSSGTNDEFQEKFFEMYPRELRQIPTFAAIGNHEGGSSDSLTATGPYYDAYVLPAQGEAGGLASGTEAYYSWDYSDVHFIALESHRSELRGEGGAMLTWLQMDLEATDKKWIVVYFHHPPYTKGSHDSDAEVAHIEMRERALPIMEAHGVDLVLGGHSHIYERSFLVHEAYDTPTTAGPHVVDQGSGTEAEPYHKSGPGGSEDGAIYIVAGHGGTNVGRDGDSPHPLMFFTEIKNGSVLVNVDGASMHIQNVRLDGVVSDDFRIVKGEVLHLTSPSGRVAAGETAEVTWISKGSSRQVDLHYSSDKGATWQAVSLGLADSGAYSWTVPDAAGEKLSLRIRDAATPSLEHVRWDTVEVTAKPPTTLLPFKSQWRSWVELPRPDWMQTKFDDRPWRREPASFGVCGCLPWEAGTDTFMAGAISTKSVYFRTTFSASEAMEYVDLSVIAESGVVVYLNGQEVLRKQVSDDAHDAGADDRGVNVYSLRVPGESILVGDNTLAVMVKKANDKGVNITFDMQVVGVARTQAADDGCGCSSTGGPRESMLGLGLLAVLLLRRRRSRHKA